MNAPSNVAGTWVQPTEPRSIRKRLAAVGVVVAVFAAWSQVHGWQKAHALVINQTESLPNWAFMVDLGRMPVRGDYVLFAPPLDPLVVKHFGAKPQPFAKIVYGVAGDVVTRKGAIVSVNGKPVGRLKPFSRQGEPLAAGPVGTIPRGCYYAGSPHKDGFDSRYAAIGFVCRRAIVGVGSPIL